MNTEITQVSSPASPLRERKRQQRRRLRLTACLVAVPFGTLLLNNCGGSLGALVSGVPDTSQSAGSSSSTPGGSSSSDSSSAGDPPGSSSSSSSYSYSSSSMAAGWVDVSPSLPGHTVGTAAVVPGQDKVIVLTGKAFPFSYYTSLAYSSVDGGATWQELGQGSGSAPLTLAPIGIAFDPKDATGNTFWVYGFYAGATGGLFSTTDGGSTFTAYAVGANPYEIDGIAIDAGSPTVLVGQHEMTQAVYRTTDGGATWTNVGATLPAGFANSEYPYIIDSQTYLIGCSFAIDGTYDTGARAVGGTPAIFRTTDGGATWKQVSINYKVFGSPTLLNGTLYWAYYNETDGGLLASSDQGRTWSVLVPAGLTWSVTPVALPSGKLAVINTRNEIQLYTPGTDAPIDLVPAFPLTSPLSDGLVESLAFDPVRSSYFGWVTSGGIERLDVK